MSISSSTRIAGPYTGNGTTTSFPFAFKVFTSSEIVVEQTNAAGTVATLTLTQDYTVALNADQDANPGGTVDILVAPATGLFITLTSAVTETQSLTLTNQGGFYPQTINDALDRLTILTQQTSERVGRKLGFGLSNTQNADIASETERANKYLVFDSNGLPTVSPIAVGTIISSIVSDLITMRASTVTYDEVIQLKYHTTAGDGGGGLFRGVTGAAPGTYVDNNGTIIVPTGGDGSAAWVRDYSGAVNVDWFGASKVSITTDCTAACQQAINYAQSILANVEFSPKQYSISRQGGVIGYDGINQNYYALLVTAGITVNLNGAELLVDESEANYATAILCHLTTGANIINGKVTNTALTPALITTKHLFTGCSVGLLNCTSSHVKNIICSSTRGGVQMYGCLSSSISNCESDISTAINSKLGTHFGCYSGTDNEIANCTSHVSCGDGDIFLYGSGRNNRLLNNHAYNYVKGDATKTLIFNIGQGMGADSGQHEATISGNYVYGHYYGIDVKNDSDGTKVIGNTVAYCKAGLSCRLGEAPGRNYRVLFNGNIANIGTGMGALNTNLIDGVYEAVGFFGEKATGLTVSNTTIGIQHSASITINAGGIYISDGAPLPPDGQQGLQLVNNNISAQTNVGGVNCRFTGALVTVTNKGAATNIKDVTVSGQFDALYGSGALKDACSFTGVKGLSFSANLSRTYSTYAIALTNCYTVNISSNFSWHRGILTALNSNTITMSGCALGGNNSTNQGGYRETVHLDTCTFVNIHGNTGIDSATGGKFVNAIASDWISIQGNVIDMPQFSVANFVTFDATGVNTLVANNLIK